MIKRVKRKRSEPVQEPPSEIILWRGSPRLTAFYGFYVAGMLVLFISAAVARVWCFPLMAWVAVVAFSGAMFFLPHEFRRAWRFTVTSHRVRADFRLIAQHSLEIPIKYINCVLVNQGPLGRIFNFGEVRVVACPPFPSVTLWGISSPRTVAEKISALLRR